MISVIFLLRISDARYIIPGIIYQTNIGPSIFKTHSCVTYSSFSTTNTSDGNPAAARFARHNLRGYRYWVDLGGRKEPARGTATVDLNYDYFYRSSTSYSHVRARERVPQQYLPGTQQAAVWT